MLTWGVTPVESPPIRSTDHMLTIAAQAVLDAGVAAGGDVVVITAGRPGGDAGQHQPDQGAPPRRARSPPAPKQTPPRSLPGGQLYSADESALPAPPGGAAPGRRDGPPHGAAQAGRRRPGDRTQDRAAAYAIQQAERPCSPPERAARPRVRAGRARVADQGPRAAPLLRQGQPARPAGPAAGHRARQGPPGDAGGAGPDGDGRHRSGRARKWSGSRRRPSGCWGRRPPATNGCSGSGSSRRRSCSASAPSGQTVAGTVPAPDRAQYDRLRARMPDGMAVAPVIQGRCEGCRTTLPSAEVQQARRAEELVYCSRCGRILHVPVG